MAKRSEAIFCLPLRGEGGPLAVDEVEKLSPSLRGGRIWGSTTSSVAFGDSFPSKGKPKVKVFQKMAEQSSAIFFSAKKPGGV